MIYRLQNIDCLDKKIKDRLEKRLEIERFNNQKQENSWKR